MRASLNHERAPFLLSFPPFKSALTICVLSSRWTMLVFLSPSLTLLTSCIVLLAALANCPVTLASLTGNPTASSLPRIVSFSSAGPERRRYAPGTERLFCMRIIMAMNCCCWVSKPSIEGWTTSLAFGDVASGKLKLLKEDVATATALMLSSDCRALLALLLLAAFSSSRLVAPKFSISSSTTKFRTPSSSSWLISSLTTSVRKDPSAWLHIPPTLLRRHLTNSSLLLWLEAKSSE
mmetsp:Transcript_23408/g.44046  ORF Transcript_23408/g.44046 Transcript_23408/m.44046 type:complete len:236 (-) Transcript_23408:971-1678(-)